MSEEQELNTAEEHDECFIADTSITKTEQFDPTMARHIQTQQIDSVSKARIRAIIKGAYKGNQIDVTYKLGKYLRNEHSGRWCSLRSFGLQGLSRDIRNALAQKYYWDIDFVNCQVDILRQIAQRNGWVHTQLDFYYNNRKQLFEDIMKQQEGITKDHLKERFISILFGGDRKRDDPPFLFNEFFSEVRPIMVNLTKLYPKLFKSREKLKKYNAVGSTCGVILQTEERKCLEALDFFFTKHGRNLAVFIHDGGYVEKLPHEKEFPQELLREAEQFIEQKVGYKLKLDIKEITTSFSIAKVEMSPDKSYENVKAIFEMKHFLCLNLSRYFEELDDDLIVKTEKDMEICYNSMTYETINEDKTKVTEHNFLKTWFNDSEKRTYNRVDFYPTPLICPSTVYNLWKGFEIEDTESTPLNEDQQLKLTYIYDHLFLLSNKEQPNNDYIKCWIASIFQQPSRKIGVALLFKSVQGMGKELGFFKLMSNIMGKKYAFLSGDFERDIVGSFDSMLKGKLLIGIDEAAAKATGPNKSKLKSLFTCEKDSINGKGKNQMEVNSYTNFVSFSNDDFPWPIEPGDRRHFPTDIKQPKPPKSYFTRLVECIGDKQVLRAFYDDMLKIDISTWDPIDNRPMSEFHQDMMDINYPLETRFFIHFINGLADDYSRSASFDSLWKTFNEYLEEEFPGNKNKPSISRLAFSKKLKKMENPGFIYNRSGGTKYDINKKLAKEWLIEQKYITPQKSLRHAKDEAIEEY